MPKGQYERKPRAHRSEMPDHNAEVERIATLLTQPAEPVLAAAPIPQAAEKPYPFPERTKASFDDWMDADEPIVPHNDMITRMVALWAANACAGDHSTTWLTVNDGRDLEVTLITEHGTTILTEPAGQWREPDIEKALTAMRAQLGV